MSVKYVDASATFGPRDAVADRLVEVRAKQPRKHFAHTPELEWSTGGPQGDTPATLRRPAKQETAAPVVPPPQFAHHTNRNSVYAAGVRHVERQSQLLAATPPTKPGPNGGGGVGERITMLEAEVNALRAQLAASAATPQAAPKAAPAPQQPQQSVQQMLDAQQARAYREAVQFANRSAVRPIGLKG